MGNVLISVSSELNNPITYLVELNVKIAGPYVRLADVGSYVPWDLQYGRRIAAKVQCWEEEADRPC